MVGIACAQCGARMVAALWSEHVSERCVRNLWSCDECGYQFETHVYLAALKSVTHQDEYSCESGRQPVSPAVDHDHALSD